jgi:6,7-dimethyl-8-ribityllumazine synthase
MAENYDVDAIITLGTVIQGDTPHFTYICQSVSYGLTELNLSYEIPFIFGVLTVNTLEQALERAGGKYGNKGSEVAVAAIKMALYN